MIRLAAGAKVSFQQVYRVKTPPTAREFFARLFDTDHGTLLLLLLYLHR